MTQKILSVSHKDLAHFKDGLAAKRKTSNAKNELINLKPAGILRTKTVMNTKKRVEKEEDTVMKRLSMKMRRMSKNKIINRTMKKSMSRKTNQTEMIRSSKTVTGKKTKTAHTGLEG